MASPGQRDRLRSIEYMRQIEVGATVARYGSDPARRRVWTIVKTDYEKFWAWITIRSGKRQLRVNVPFWALGPNLGMAGLQSVSLRPSNQVARPRIVRPVIVGSTNLQGRPLP